MKQFIELLYTRSTISTPPPKHQHSCCTKATAPLTPQKRPCPVSAQRLLPRQGNPCSPQTLSLLCPTPCCSRARRPALPWLFKSFTPSLPQIKHKQEKEISNSPSKKHFPEARGITRFLKMRVLCSSCTLHGTWGGRSTQGREGLGLAPGCSGAEKPGEFPLLSLHGRPLLGFELSNTNLFFGSFATT